LKQTSEPFPWCQKRYSSPWGFAGAGGDLRADAEVAAGGLLAAA